MLNYHDEGHRANKGDSAPIPDGMLERGEANPSSIRLDGVEIYRSLKKNSGFVTIDGEKVYTSYSGKASRTVK